MSSAAAAAGSSEAILRLDARAAELEAAAEAVRRRIKAVADRADRIRLASLLKAAPTKFFSDGNFWRSLRRVTEPVSVRN